MRTLKSETYSNGKNKVRISPTGNSFNCTTDIFIIDELQDMEGDKSFKAAQKWLLDSGYRKTREVIDTDTERIVNTF